MQGFVISCGAVVFFQKSRNLSRSLLINNNFYCVLLINPNWQILSPSPNKKVSHQVALFFNVYKRGLRQMHLHLGSLFSITLKLQSKNSIQIQHKRQFFWGKEPFWQSTTIFWFQIVGLVWALLIHAWIQTAKQAKSGTSSRWTRRLQEDFLTLSYGQLQGGP